MIHNPANPCPKQGRRDIINCLSNCSPMVKPRILLALLTIVWNIATAQNYAIVIKGGHVIDPKNNINEVMDIAVNDGKIVKVAKSIDESKAAQVVNAKGLYVTPGLIDAHVDVFYGTDPERAY